MRGPQPISIRLPRLLPEVLDIVVVPAIIKIPIKWFPIKMSIEYFFLLFDVSLAIQ
jgi:hypothetical protein